jgi:xylulokinase
MTDRPFLLGVDIGSSTCKVMLTDREGRSLGQGQAAYVPHLPRPYWAEMDPELWYSSFAVAVRHCLSAAGVAARDVLALSVCGPAHNVALLDADDHLLRPMILWSDRRSVAQAEWLERRHGQRVFDTSFQAVDPSWTLAQLLWVKQNEPEVWRALRRIVIGKDYLNYRLTGAWSTDWYDAAGTQLFDFRARAWSPQLCELIELPMDTLPPIQDATAIVGAVSAQAADDTGLAPGTLVVQGSGDTVVEALDTGVLDCGQSIVKLATSGTVTAITAEPRPNRKLLTYHHLVSGRCYSIAATNSGAASAQWLADALGPVLAAGNDAAAIVSDLAAQVAPGSEGLLFHPYLQGERSPHWDPRLHGSFVGLTRRHDIRHMARAVLEGVAFSLRECRELLLSLNFALDNTQLIGGGCRSPVWRQIMADVLGIELSVPALGGAARGAALVAGIGSRHFADLREAASHQRMREVLTPSDQATARYDQLYPLYQQVTQALTPVDHALGDLFQ